MNRKHALATFVLAAALAAAAFHLATLGLAYLTAGAAVFARRDA